MKELLNDKAVAVVEKKKREYEEKVVRTVRDIPKTLAEAIKKGLRITLSTERGRREKVAVLLNKVYEDIEKNLENMRKQAKSIFGSVKAFDKILQKEFGTNDFNKCFNKMLQEEYGTTDKEAIVALMLLTL
ncbi:hypothetical protein FACS189465_1560 [Clostridia bacterium]|nr:hypothetical protein FACS189465_1560 [Clostridia bacterium]